MDEKRSPPLIPHHCWDTDIVTETSGAKDENHATKIPVSGKEESKEEEVDIALAKDKCLDFNELALQESSPKHCPAHQGACACPVLDGHKASEPFRDLVVNSDNILLLRNCSDVVYLELPEGPDMCRTADSSEKDDPSPSSQASKVNHTATFSEFSESVRLLKSHSGLVFNDPTERVDDSYAMLQVVNLMATVMDDLKGVGGFDLEDFEPKNAESASEQNILEILDIANYDIANTASDNAADYTSICVNELPDEVMHYIFSKFALNELCSTISPVCRRWHRLASDPIHYQEICGSQMSTETLCTVLKRAPLLKRLDLGSRNELLLDEAVFFAQHCPLLQELNLAFCDTLNNFLLKIITDKCTNLRQINLEGCLAVDDASLELLTRLPHLHRINLSHCNMVQTEGVEVLATKLTRITELDIDGIPYVMDSALFELVKYHGRHLEKLNIDGAELTDVAIKALQGMSVMCELKLSFAELLTDVALYHLKGLRHPLKALKMKKGRDFSTESLLDLFQSPCLNLLQSLDLSECVSVEDTVVLEMIKCCGKTLRQLALCWCWNITDPALDAIVDGCPVMESLELVGVHRVKGHCLARIPARMPHLKLLDLQQCNQVIDELVVDVVRQLPQLVAYNYYGERFQFVSKDVLMIK